MFEGGHGSKMQRGVKLIEFVELEWRIPSIKAYMQLQYDHI